MHSGSSLTEAQRSAAVALFEQGWRYRATATHLGVSPWAVRDLRRRWALHDRRVLVAKPTKTSYTFEFKLEVVRKVVYDGVTPSSSHGNTGCPQASSSNPGCVPTVGSARTV